MRRASMVFAGTGRSDHHDIVAAAGGDLQGAFGMFLPLDLAEILTVFATAGKQRLQINPAGVDPFASAQKLHHLGKRLWRR